jgi:hypothetical protein
MGKNGTGSPRWLLVVKPDQRELFEVLRTRLEGSGVQVLLDRRSRERRRGSLGPAMDRRTSDRRRQRPIALLSTAAADGESLERTATAGSVSPGLAAGHPPNGGSDRNRAVTHRCPTCAAPIELELPRFPHPPARVEMEVEHVTGNGRDGHHYVEIAAFTVSGRLILSQRVPARHPA